MKLISLISQRPLGSMLVVAGKDNAFIPMLTAGTSMEGYVCKIDGYFGPKGRVLKAGHPGADHLWVYAMAFRLYDSADIYGRTR